MVRKVFPNQFRIIDIFSVKHPPQYVNSGLSKFVIAYNLSRETLVDYSCQSSLWLVHMIYKHVGVPVQWTLVVKIKEKGTMAGVDVDTLTMEQYLALSRENQEPGLVKPEIEGNVNFKIKSQFMTLSPGTKTRMPTITLIGSSTSLAYLIFLESLKTQSCSEFFPSLLLEPLSDGYCPPSMTAKQLEDIHNFKQEGDESLYKAWERYNDLLYKCPTHDINNHRKKFGFTDVNTASTPMETQKLLLKDEDSEKVDVHLYRLMIGSLMYPTSSSIDIMFVVCACARYQVNPKVSHLHVVKRIFRLIFIAMQEVDCSCYFITEAEDSNEKKLIQMIKIHTDKNVADLLTKAFVMLLGINLLLLLKVNAARHKLTTGVEMDGKKIIITETTIRRYLQLEDAEGIDCLSNATNFEQLTLMDAKTTAWNEFSSTMASAIICLATNQKFNFSKYIFDSMVKNVDNVNKFLMYPRFVQVFVNQQAGDMSNHKRIYVTPSHTKKVFGNMKREGKGSAIPTDPYRTPTITQPSSSQPQKKHKPRKPKKKDTVGKYKLKVKVLPT
ncbi:hypothetical protein Tco_0420954 [Tanacetum coccineum]